MTSERNLRGATMGSWWLKGLICLIFSALLPVPFYFMELLVGVIQALVFMLLTAVFTMLIMPHDEGHDAAHH